MTIEEKSRAYAESRIAVKNVRVMCITPREKRLERFDAYDIEQAYEDGATEALASQWVSVEERLPEEHEEVLTYSIAPKYAEDENAIAYYDGEDWYTTYGNHIRPSYWMPIPQLNPEKQSI